MRNTHSHIYTKSTHVNTRTHTHTMSHNVTYTHTQRRTHIKALIDEDTYTNITHGQI